MFLQPTTVVQTRLGFLPLIMAGAAIAAPIIQGAMESKSAKESQSAAEDAARVQMQMQRKALKAQALSDEQKSKTTRTLIWVGAGVVTAGLALWLLKKRRK